LNRAAVSDRSVNNDGHFAQDDGANIHLAPFATTPEPSPYSSDHGEILAIIAMDRLGFAEASATLPSLRFQRVRFTERWLLHPFTATAPISVQGINDSGQIVGYDGYFQGFLGTPVHRNATLPHLEVMLGGRKT
jgi:hypothetical protein